MLKASRCPRLRRLDLWTASCSRVSYLPHSTNAMFSCPTFWAVRKVEVGGKERRTTLCRRGSASRWRKVHKRKRVSNTSSRCGSVNCSNRHRASSVARPLTLSLFVFGVFRADNVESALAPDQTAPFAHGFDRRANFHASCEVRASERGMEGMLDPAGR